MLRRGEVFFESAEELNDASEFRPRFILKGTTELWARLSQFILQEICLRSDFYELTTRDTFHALYKLGMHLGSLIKKSIGNRDLEIENLGTLFAELLSSLIDKKFTSLERRWLLDSSKNFIKRQLPRLLEDPLYVASFSRNPKNPTMLDHYADAEKGFVIILSAANETIGVYSPINILNGTRPLFDKNFGIEMEEIGVYKEERLQLKPVTYCRRPPKVNAFHH